MQVGAVSNVAFQGAVNEKGKKTGGAGKAVASYCVPGLGQLIDGRKKEAAGFFGSAVALGAAGLAVVHKMVPTIMESSIGAANVKEGLKNTFKTLAQTTKGKALIGAYAAVVVAGFAHAIARTVDAYKGIREPKEEKFTVQG